MLFWPLREGKLERRKTCIQVAYKLYKLHICSATLATRSNLASLITVTSPITVGGKSKQGHGVQSQSTGRPIVDLCQSMNSKFGQFEILFFSTQNRIEFRNCNGKKILSFQRQQLFFVGCLEFENPRCQQLCLLSILLNA